MSEAKLRGVVDSNVSRVKKSVSGRVPHRNSCHLFVGPGSRRSALNRYICRVTSSFRSATADVRPVPFGVYGSNILLVVHHRDEKRYFRGQIVWCC